MFVELRVHGVSGTPPVDMLGRPLVKQVAGDTDGRFFRPVDAAGAEVRAADGHVLEGYHWGPQTSGTWRQALWLALVPFGLVNAAYFMLPDGGGNGARVVARAALRVLAIVLTGLVVLSIAQAAVDLFAWQWTGVGGRSGNPRWWLAGGFAAAVLALLVIRFLVGAPRKLPPNGEPPQDATMTGLAGGEFYTGDRDMPALRHLHLTAGLTVLSVLAAALVRQFGGTGVLYWVALGTAGLDGRARRAAGRPVEGPRRGAGVLRGPPADGRAVGWHRVADRVIGRDVAGDGLPGEPARHPAWHRHPRTRGRPARAGRVGRAGPRRGATGRADTGARVRHSRSGGFSAAWSVRSSPRSACSSGSGSPRRSTTACCGRCGRPTTRTSMSLPLFYLRIAFAAGVAVALVVVARAACCRPGCCCPPSGSRRSCVTRRPTELLPDEQVRGVARAWWLARLKFSCTGSRSRSPRPAPCCTAAVVEAVEAAPATSARRSAGRDGATWLSDCRDLPGLDLVTVGTVALVLLGGFLVYLGRRAVGDSAVRRGACVVWDVVAFWPAAVHPLVPPPYSPKVIEDLRRRIEWHVVAARHVPGAGRAQPGQPDRGGRADQAVGGLPVARSRC